MKRYLESLENLTTLDGHFQGTLSSLLYSFGINWCPFKINQTRNKNLDLKKQSEKGKEENHIMISYNWGSKPIVLKVRDRLKAAGFNVWMDVDNMSKFEFA